MIGLLMLAAVAETPPSAALIDRIEAQALARDLCVRPLSQWQRSYSFGVSFGPQGMTIHHDVIWISMTEVGHDGAKAGRSITVMPPPPKIDDSQFRLVSARYDIASGRFSEWFCGSNWPSAKEHPK